jgi:hypothetical protein
LLQIKENIDAVSRGVYTCRFAPRALFVLSPPQRSTCIY